MENRRSGISDFFFKENVIKKSKNTKIGQYANHISKNSTRQRVKNQGCFQRGWG